MVLFPETVTEPNFEIIIYSGVNFSDTVTLVDKESPILVGHLSRLIRVRDVPSDYGIVFLLEKNLCEKKQEKSLVLFI